MKAYIMLEHSIMGMGGAQKYVSYKIRRLKELGWKCFVFSGVDNGDVLVPGLIQYKEYAISELLRDPNYYSFFKRRRIIDQIIKAIGYADSYIIESNSLSCALWGEILAKRVGGYNFVFLLTETNGNVHERYLTFFRFKFIRRELAGIKEQSLIDLFRNDGTVNTQNNYILYALGDSLLSENDNSLLRNISASGLTIASIGRLEKPCEKKIAKSLCKLCKIHQEREFNVLFIGSSNDKSDEIEIKNMFKGLNNVNLIMPGFLVPIPLSLFPVVDLFISSSGSANISYRQDRPTISVDGKDGYAIGVLGYTTSNALFRTIEPQIDITDLAEKVLFSDFLSSYTYSKAEIIDYEDKFKKHLDVINSLQGPHEYYDVNNIKYSHWVLLKGKIKILIGRY